MKAVTAVMRQQLGEKPMVCFTEMLHRINTAPYFIEVDIKISPDVKMVKVFRISATVPNSDMIDEESSDMFFMCVKTYYGQIKFPPVSNGLETTVITSGYSLGAEDIRFLMKDSRSLRNTLSI
jgi:hypothetical protein